MKPKAVNRRVSDRMLAVLCVLLLVMSLVPLYVLALYNHPFYDDFGFSIRIHHVWNETGSVLEAVKEAWQNMQDTRQTWQGNYTATFLSGIQPGVFNEGLYFLTTFILLTSLVVGYSALYAAGMRKLLGVGWPAVIQMTSLLLFVMIQMTPAVDEAYFWFNGGIGYTFSYALFALSLGVCIHLWCCTSVKKAVWLTLTLCVLTVLIGGGSYSSGLFSLLVYVCVAFLGFFRRSRWRWCYASATVLLAVGFLYSVTAPGNMVRAATLEGAGMGPVMAIAQSFYFGFGLIGDWFSLPLCVACTAGVFALIPSLLQSRYSFRYPLLVTGMCICLFCSQMTPTLFTGNYLGDGRSLNTYFFTYVTMMAFLAVYWMGWSVKRVAAHRAIDGERRGVRVGAVLVAAAVLVMGLLSYHPSGKNESGLLNLASGSAFRSLITGEAAAYDKAMSARDASMNNDEETEPVLQPVDEIPDAFMGDALENDNLEYVLRLYTEYYEKQRVTVAEGE